MTATAARGKTGRLYERRFDHDEARARHTAGEKILALAIEYGVSETAVSRALDPRRRERDNEATRRWRTGTCEDCGGPAMRLVGAKLKHNPDGRTLCLACRSKDRRTAVLVFDNGVVAVKCLTCKDWLAPARFPKGTRYRDLRPGGFHNSCRTCQTALRRAYREARKIPCTKCGAPRNPHTPGNGSRGEDSGMCHPCAVTAHNKARHA
jgi:hypothetical protein